MERHEFDFLRQLIYRHSGIFLSDKEAGVIETRVQRRAREAGFPGLPSYVARLRRGPRAREIPALLDAVTINYTYFFRQPDQFQKLVAYVLPEILRARGPGGRVRIWSAGCSSGEEPYSVAVCYAEHSGDPEAYDFRILATDINRKVLATARRGVYHRERLQRLPREHFYKYLTRDAETPEECFRIVPELRQLVVFRRFNILHPARPMQGNLDAIFCRNVMMYFDACTRTRILEEFRRYLVPGGCLFVGESDEFRRAPPGFDTLYPCIYRRT